MEKKIRVLSRGLQIIECLGSESRVSLAQLNRVTGLPKSTLLRILHTLQVLGWVYRSRRDDCYRLSYRLQGLGDGLLAADALAEASGPILDELQRRLFWPSYLAVRRGLAMEVVERTRTKRVLVVNPEVLGVRAEMLRSAIGHAYLGHCSETEREEILERLASGGGEAGRLARDRIWVEETLAQVRKRGYGRREPNQWPAPATDLCAIAVPVFVQGRVKACLNLVWPEGAVESGRERTHLFPQLRAAADRLAEALEQSALAF
ncbi:helix-turn-helix domain-containing protein [Motiliproteus sp. SC1-56]|uniref:helix-turn-helix domain-containing protein n=1 Tax=Motiliproteus sp. SC1-56 TaxID=2799565 RepID=UPI001A8EAEAF|nr:helix-turn-helix domain-containing protein [Motiliproteus sp. SC1-56]